jgi:hypothetical protein
MASRRDRSSATQRETAAQRRSPLSVRQVRGAEGWELVHPRCAEERTEDLDEVEAMLQAGELDVARDELRWLLEECHDCLAAHRLLGEIAALEGDWKLARGHFGYAYDLGLRALPAESLAGPLPYARAANRAFHAAGKGLAVSLIELGRAEQAAAVIDQLLRLDDCDPLGVRALRARLHGLPVLDSPGGAAT